jgi:CDP-2,3-bis-(O-geranylgeranyl)-sn-glycerol synthase
MIENSLIALWFFLPAAVANVTPVFLSRWLGNWFDCPLDFNRKIGGKPILGRHKTWRGLIFGTIAAVLTLYVQAILAESTGWGHELFVNIGYKSGNIILVGACFALGALGGDAIESFIKRRLGKKSGQSWFPFDQIDFIIGASLTTLPFVSLAWYNYIFVIVIWSLVSYLSSWLGVKLNFKNTV